LACRGLTDASGQHVAQKDLVYRFEGQPGSFDRGAHGQRAQAWRG
jgi:hypothetical protein